MEQSAEKIIELNEVSMVFDNRKVLTDVNLTVKRNDFIAITGPNGGGKTTLLRIILKLLVPTSGTVAYFNNGNPMRHIPIGYLPQKNHIDARFPITVRQVVESGLYEKTNIFTRFKTSQTNERTEDMLRLIGVESLADNVIGSLSGGQLQRVLLGRALISNPKVLVLDEPLSYVDKRFEQRIYEIIGEIAPSTTILLVSHEMTSIAPMANRHIIVDNTIHLCHAHRHFTLTECE